MGYHTASPRQRVPFGVPVWKKDAFLVTEGQGRYWLYKDGYDIAELISGKQGLDKYFHGKFERWIESVKAKDLKKADGMIVKANKVIEEARFIRNLWGITK